MCVFSGLFDLCRDLSILTWSWPFPWASLERGTPPMQPDLQQRRTIRNTGKKIEPLYILIHSKVGRHKLTWEQLRKEHKQGDSSHMQTQIPPPCIFHPQRIHSYLSAVTSPTQHRPGTQATRLLQKAPWPNFAAELVSWEMSTLTNVFRIECSHHKQERPGFPIESRNS